MKVKTVRLKAYGFEQLMFPMTYNLYGVRCTPDGSPKEKEWHCH